MLSKNWTRYPWERRNLKWMKEPLRTKTWVSTGPSPRTSTLMLHDRIRRIKCLHEQPSLELWDKCYPSIWELICATTERTETPRMFSCRWGVSIIVLMLLKEIESTYWMKKPTSRLNQLNHARVKFVVGYRLFENKISSKSSSQWSTSTTRRTRY